jgi:predicted dehydrogenase
MRRSPGAISTAATNVTPDRIHHATSLALIAAGKHVFCEKPLAEHYAQALEMTEAAEAAGVINMVNLTYRNVAPLQRAREMVLAGELGTIRHVEASYLQSWLVSRAWGDWRTESRWLWRLSTGHGSNGVLGDVGIHILDFAAYGAATDIDHVFARLKTFNKAPGGQIGEYLLDANDSFTMSVDFTNGALGVIHATRWATGHLNELKLRIYGEKGSLEVTHRPDGSDLRGCFGDDIENAVWRDIEVPPGPHQLPALRRGRQNRQAGRPHLPPRRQPAEGHRPRDRLGTRTPGAEPARRAGAGRRPGQAHSAADGRSLRKTDTGGRAPSRVGSQ